MIALFALLTFPLGILPWSVNEMFKSRVSYKRIKHFLMEKDINDSDIKQMDEGFGGYGGGGSNQNNNININFNNNSSLMSEDEDAQMRQK